MQARLIRLRKDGTLALPNDTEYQLYFYVSGEQCYIGYMKLSLHICSTLLDRPLHLQGIFTYVQETVGNIPHIFSSGAKYEMSIDRERLFALMPDGFSMTDAESRLNEEVADIRDIAERLDGLKGKHAERIVCCLKIIATGIDSLLGKRDD
mgnify:FL=1